MQHIGSLNGLLRGKDHVRGVNQMNNMDQSSDVYFSTSSKRSLTTINSTVPTTIPSQNSGHHGNDSMVSTSDEIRSTFVGRRINVWSTMTKRGFRLSRSKEDWSTIDQSSLPSSQCSSKNIRRKNGCLSSCIVSFHHDVRRGALTLKNHPHIVFCSTLVFLTILILALLMVEMLHNQYEKQCEFDAFWEATETSRWIVDAFNKAFIPLQSLQQAVMYSDVFKSLPYDIGNHGEQYAAPSIFGPKSTAAPDYRDVTGICDNQELKANFHNIIDTISSNFGYHEIVLNYRIAPYGVICLEDTPINEDDTILSDLHSGDVIGFDTLNTPNEEWTSIIDGLYHDRRKDIVVKGPMNDFVDAGNVIFCAHIAVNMTGYNMTLKQGDYAESWGHVMHIFQWSKLLEQSGIYEHFERKKMNFHLTRVDEIYETESQDYRSETNTIAKSENRCCRSTNLDCSNYELSEENSVSTIIETPNGQWTHRVSIPCDCVPSFVCLKLGIILLSLILSILFSLVLLGRQQYKTILYKIMPKDAIVQLKRDKTVVQRYNIVTICATDIVGFTPIADEISPLQVMEIMNDLYSKFDKIAARHKVYKVETVSDSYMVVGGAQDSLSVLEAAEKVALFGLDLIEYVKNYSAPSGERIIVRAGIASGPVVAGVLGKTMPRYCFFGDTVNSALTMEATSQDMMIQAAEFTARLLEDAPNFRFGLEGRSEIDIKGKNISKTWWIKNVNSLRTHSHQEANELEHDSSIMPVDFIIQAMALSKQDWTRIGLSDSVLVGATSNTRIMINRISSLLEHYLTLAISIRKDLSELSFTAKTQLKAYVSEIASLYNHVEYHNLEHVTHVTVSMCQLIDAIRESFDECGGSSFHVSNDVAQSPFTQFCLVFACFIHDVQHTGQSNVILKQTKHKVYSKFQESSAERNSMKVAMDILFQMKYTSIRRTIIPTIKDRMEFGRTVYTCLLSSDIASQHNLERFKNLFNVMKNAIGDNITINSSLDHISPSPLHEHIELDPELCPTYTYREDLVKFMRLPKELDIRASIQECFMFKDLQHCLTCGILMQVADVAHLLQGWDQFIKFNFRLFKELMTCHDKNLLAIDPSMTWNNGQVAFLTNYAIPLSQKMEFICGDNVAVNKLRLEHNARSHMGIWKGNCEQLLDLFISGYVNDESDRVLVAQCKVEIDEAFSV